MLGLKLEVEIDRSYKILTRLRRNRLDLGLSAPAAVHYHFSITGFAPKVFVVILFESTFSDDVTPPKTLVLVFFLFELLLTSFTYITKYLGQRLPKPIEPLRT